MSMKYRRDVLLPPPRGPFRVHTNMDSRVVRKRRDLGLRKSLTMPFAVIVGGDGGGGCCCGGWSLSFLHVLVLL